MNKAWLIASIIFLSGLSGFFVAPASAMVCLNSENACILESSVNEAEDAFTLRCDEAGGYHMDAQFDTCSEFGQAMRNAETAVPLISDPGAAPGEPDNSPLPADLRGDIRALDKFNTSGGRQLSQILGSIIKIGIGVLGAFALLVFIYGGLVWMLAAGNSDREKKGLDTLFWGGLGIAVIFSSYAIVSYIFQAFQ